MSGPTTKTRRGLSSSRNTPSEFLARWKKRTDDPWRFELEFRQMVNRFMFWESTQHEGAKQLGRRGGQIGGHIRAANLSPERRSEIARIAARKRWGDRAAGGAPLTEPRP